MAARRNRRNNWNPFWGTSKIGQIKTSKAHLVECLGEPTLCNDHIPGGFFRQTLYTWQFRTASGPVEIYDYKEWEDPDFADNKVITWSVAGRSHKYTAREVHPINKWVADRTGLPVEDTRPHCWRPRHQRPQWGDTDAERDALLTAPESAAVEGTNERRA